MAIRQRTIPLLAAACLLAFAGLAVNQVRRTSAVWDEFVHLKAGYAALTLGDYRLGQAHPPLQRIWNALPLLAIKGIRLAPEPAPAAQAAADREVALELMIPYRFLYEDNDTERLLLPARMMSVLLGLLLALLGYLWSRRLHGALPALAALLLLCLEPNLLSHSCVVTTDLGVTCFMFGAVGCLWRLSQGVTWGNLAGLAAFFGLAQASKFTALLLGPIVLVLALARALRKEPWRVALGAPRELSSRGARLFLVAALVVLLAAAACGVIWAAYGFRYDPAPAGSVSLEDALRVDTRSPVAGAAVWAREHRLVPRAYAQGLLLQERDIGQRPAFLAGETSMTGWWFYFPVAFLLKTPLSVLVLAAVGLVLLLRRREVLLRDGLFLLVPIVVVMGFAMTSRYNIGLRHVLPVTPFVILLAAAPFAAPLPRLWRGAALALLALAAGESAAAQPHPLGFFNLLAGGSRNGYKLLVDSNVDWGQDLKEMRDWQRGAAARHPALPVSLAYFGSAPPEYYGIRATHLPGYGFYQLSRQGAGAPLRAGVYCVSVTMLQGVYSPFPGRWCVPYEKLYRETLALVGASDAAGGAPGAAEELRRKHGGERWDADLGRLRELQFARLCAALRRREPDERIGSSILVYVLAERDVRDALFGPPAELAAAVQVKGAGEPAAP